LVSFGVDALLAHLPQIRGGEHLFDDDIALGGTP
jgi:hypothetical protein